MSFYEWNSYIFFVLKVKLFSAVRNIKLEEGSISEQTRHKQ